jgi:hypothetical protein
MVFVPCFTLIVVIAVVVAIVYSVGAHQRTTQSFARLAAHHRGKFQGGGTFGFPRVNFTHGRSWVAVGVYATGGNPATYFTQVKVALPENVTRCEIYPEGMWSRFGKLVGMEDVEIGVRDFDEDYVIKGANRKELLELLTSNVRQQIDRLRYFLGNHDIYVSFERLNLLVKKRSYIREYETLVQYVQLVLQLVDLVVAVDAEGIEFTDDASPPNAIGAMCQICGEEITEQAVFCRRCQTPHHQDCWHYYGACSTYGCQEKKYIRPDSRRGKRAAERM